MRVTYNVCVFVSIWGQNPFLSLPVVIGNVPLEEGTAFGYQPPVTPLPTAPLLEPTDPTYGPAYGSYQPAIPQLHDDADADNIKLIK